MQAWIRTHASRGGGRTGFLKKIRRRKKQDDARPTQSTCKTGPNIEVAIIFRSEIVPPGPAKITTQTDRQTDRHTNKQTDWLIRGRSTLLHAGSLRPTGPTTHYLWTEGNRRTGSFSGTGPNISGPPDRGKPATAIKKNHAKKTRRFFSLTPLQFYPGQNVREMVGKCSGGRRLSIEGGPVGTKLHVRKMFGECSGNVREMPRGAKHGPLGKRKPGENTPDPIGTDTGFLPLI